eukprot:gnl/TRDRNA2_/TRDRNA2_44554_c0_seq1.p1 gnl/TRDRNA2_/TRDRNA2_44554_c0~~gnl/TRDRNA2_/TRDRNA2_44554_c0_seq1.p1  ORF type:complete len:190 (+),score=22.35 gnl/TRDRNA2_/TRDRNA2_44554_c0_seq1:65-634(+)
MMAISAVSLVLLATCVQSATVSWHHPSDTECTPETTGGRVKVDDASSMPVDCLEAGMTNFEGTEMPDTPLPVSVIAKCSTEEGNFDMSLAFYLGAGCKGNPAGFAYISDDNQVAFGNGECVMTEDADNEGKKTGAQTPFMATGVTVVPCNPAKQPTTAPADDADSAFSSKFGMSFGITALVALCLSMWK